MYIPTYLPTFTICAPSASPLVASATGDGVTRLGLYELAGDYDTTLSIGKKKPSTCRAKVYLACHAYIMYIHTHTDDDFGEEGQVAIQSAFSYALIMNRLFKRLGWSASGRQADHDGMEVVDDDDPRASIQEGVWVGKRKQCTVYDGNCERASRLSKDDGASFGGAAMGK